MSDRFALESTWPVACGRRLPWSASARRWRTWQAARVPYGYTISLWTASAAPAAHFGPPGGGDIVAFVAGAMLAFLLVGAVARVDLAHQVPSPVSSAIVLNILPLLALALAPVSLLVPWKATGFELASFLVTLGYAIGVTVFLELAGRQRHPNP